MTLFSRDNGSALPSSVSSVIAAGDENTQQICPNPGKTKQNMESKKVTASHAVKSPPEPQLSRSSRPSQLMSSPDDAQSFHGLSRWPSLSFSSSSNLAASSVLGQLPVSLQWDHSTASDFVPSSAGEGSTTVSSFSLPSTWTEEHNRPFSPMVYYQDVRTIVSILLSP